MPPSVSTKQWHFGNQGTFYHNRQLPDGKATVQVSTDPALLKRALKDITDKYSTDPTVTAPTHLLLFNKIDIKAVLVHTGMINQLIILSLCVYRDLLFSFYQQLMVNTHKVLYCLCLLSQLLVVIMHKSQDHQAPLNYPMHQILLMLLAIPILVYQGSRWWI